MFTKQLKLTKRAKLLLLDIATGDDRVFYMTDLPYGWTQLERKGLAYRDGTYARLTTLGLIVANEIQVEAI